MTTATYNKRIDKPVVLEDDFTTYTVSSTDNSATWYSSLSGAAGITVDDDAPGGLMKILTGTVDNNQTAVQACGEAFKLVASKPLDYSCLIKADDVSLAGVYAGLAITDTTPVGNDMANAVTDYVGFMWDGTDLFAVSGKNASASWTSTTGQKIDTGLALADDTIAELQFSWDGIDTITYRVDGVLVATITDTAATKTTICQDEAMTPTFVGQSLSAAARIVYVDYVKVQQDR